MHGKALLSSVLRGRLKAQVQRTGGRVISTWIEGTVLVLGGGGLYVLCEAIAAMLKSETALDKTLRDEKEVSGWEQ
jgi:hypothetical protein